MQFKLIETTCLHYLPRWKRSMLTCTVFMDVC